MSIVAAACGGSSSDTAETAGTVDANVKDEVAKQLGSDTSEGTGTTEEAGGGSGGSTAGTKHPATLEAWEALWEKQRAAVVERIKSEGWGSDGKTVTGPEGFTIDLSGCPSDWSETEGLSDTEIKIGHTTALSGTLADYGNIAKALEIVFRYYNDKGFFEDSEGKTRKINLIVKDDGYDSTRTIPLVDELIDSEKVFAMWTLGSPNTMKTYDKLNERCIPQPLSMTGHPAWGDPENHPWTTGLQLNYFTEAILWGAFIEERIDELTAGDGKATIAGLVMNNDFGKAYDAGMKAFLAQSSMKDRIEFVSETIEPSAPTIKDPMTTLAAKNPEMFIAMTAGTSCTQAITEAAENGLKETALYVFMPSVCKSASFVGKDKVGGDGSAANDWWVIGGGAKDYNSPKYDDGSDAWIKFTRDLLAKDGIDFHTSGSFGSGMIFNWAMIQALKIAGELDGGLTRSNFIVALRTLDMTHPTYLEGIGFNMNGNADAYFVEGSDVAQYDAAQQQWIQQGGIIELSGKSANCVWDQAVGNCT